ncbi:hypothetical protein H483_0102280 [Dietzia sp. UCD-THP]|uniref:hypothetical protein n=1 Tax=Dietzia sp. UCD-THP TaxID=1292020 RepID=UPI000363939F|nr:hypothetical protein [Dietzia sp. UCD-THP]EYT65134.1 hypothetical protein H483_0102280 [Dietzia sp. UCD-THP]
MTDPKLPRVTLREARASKTAELVDQLIDAPTVTAASKIRKLDRHQLELCLMHVVCSLDARWRIPARATPPPAVEALIAVILAAGDALESLNQPQEDQ